MLEEHRLAERRGNVWKYSHLYFLVSGLLAFLAVITSPRSTVSTRESRSNIFFKPVAVIPIEESTQPVDDCAADVESVNASEVESSTFRKSYRWWNPFYGAEDVPEEPKERSFPLLRWFLWQQSKSSGENEKQMSKSPGENERQTNSFTSMITSIIDPAILNPSKSMPTLFFGKILDDHVRLLVIANFFIAMTIQIHTAVANCFLGEVSYNVDSATTGREGWAWYLLFKVLFMSYLFEAGRLDLCVFLVWYTMLSFFRSLDLLADATTSHTTQSGQPPRPGVVRLLGIVLICDCLAAAVFVYLFHHTGASTIMLFTCDCALLEVDVFCHLLRHVGQVLEGFHTDTISEREEQQNGLQRQLRRLERRERRSPDDDEENSESNSENSTMSLESNSMNDDEGSHTSHDDERVLMEKLRQLERTIDLMEVQHTRRLSVLDTTIFLLELVEQMLTLCHFGHIWWMHGFLQYNFVDCVLAFYLQQSVTSIHRKIMERKKLDQIARSLDGTFEDASEMDIRKASAAGDVCCICLYSMSYGSVKKVGCGHLYHTHCLREVVERARSVEETKCPLCRASVVDGSHQNNSTNENVMAVPPQANTRSERALFRFSTEGILPRSLPVPAFSFEIVRRPPESPPPAVEDVPEQQAVPGNPNGEQQQRTNSLFRRFHQLFTGNTPMSPEEEARSTDQLADVFPQLNRTDLLQVLRERGSVEAAVESVIRRQLDENPGEVEVEIDSQLGAGEPQAAT